MFGQKEVKGFWQLFSAVGIRADLNKVKVVRNWPRPDTVKEVKSMLQTVQYTLCIWVQIY